MTRLLPADEPAPPHFPLPSHPRLRPIEPQWVEAQGEPHLWLRDPLGLHGGPVLIPAPLAPLLAALDGTRDVDALARRFTLQTGIAATPAAVGRLVSALDEALVLDSPRLRWALGRARAAYRRQPHRPPALAGRSYPAHPAALEALFDGWVAGGTAAYRSAPLAPIATAAGVLSPHIDYTRGGPLYARTWQAAAAAVASAEVVVVFGTDHHGGPARLTPTLQKYATPWGTLPLDAGPVERLAEVLGGDDAFFEELDHRDEHSIELAAVWLHWTLRRAGRAVALPPLIPVLCGSFHGFTQDEPAPSPDGAGALDALRDALRGRRTLVVAAADLAHVGPAFGDAAPLSAGDRAAHEAADTALLAAAGAGDAAGVLARVQGERDRRRVCGLPPLYWSLRLLACLTGGPVTGHATGYVQCPADAAGGSIVSIAGMLWE